MSRFVVCAACGARIKAGWVRCLRCGEVLQAATASVEADRLPRFDQPQLLMLGTVVSLLAIAGLAVVWQRHAPERLGGEVVRLAPPSSASAPVPAQAQPGQAAPGSAAPLDSGAFIDSARTAAAAFTTGSFESARASYEEALAKRPDDPEILNNLGQALVRLGRVDEARSRFERAVALSPETWAYRFNLAHAAGRLGQWDRAVTEYREAQRIFPADYATVFNLALVLHKKGDEQGAIPEFQKAIELAPGEASFHVSLGISLEASGRVNEAVAAFRRYLEVAPDAPDVAQVKAHIEALVAAQAPTAPPAS